MLILTGRPHRGSVRWRDAREASSLSRQGQVAGRSTDAQPQASTPATIWNCMNMLFARRTAIQYGTLLLICTGRIVAHDWSIVPGKRVGPVTSTSSEAELKAAFGAAAVKRALIRITDDTKAPGLEIDGDKPAESLAVVWPRSEGGLRWPLLVIPCYARPAVDCRWQTAEGVRVGMGLADLQRANERPFLLYPDINSKAWKNAWWSTDILAKNAGKLWQALGEDIELEFEIRMEPENAEFGYVASNESPLHGSNLPVSRMFVHLLSQQRRTPSVEWTIGGRFYAAITPNKTELLRETLGPDQAHRTVEQGEEGIGLHPGVSVFDGQEDRRVSSSQAGMNICGFEYKNCRWRLQKPFALIHDASASCKSLNGRLRSCSTDLLGTTAEWSIHGTAENWRSAGPARGHLSLFARAIVLNVCLVTALSLRSDDPDLLKTGLFCDVSIIVAL